MKRRLNLNQKYCDPQIGGVLLVYTEINIGKVGNMDLRLAFQFIAMPNPNGNCKFQIFGTEARYTQ